LSERRPDLWIAEDDWRSYESYVFGVLQSRFPGARVIHNAHLAGLKSGIDRQIDILVERKDGGFDFKIAIDCKCYKHNVDVKDVESFLGMLDDVRVSKGVLLTTKGYSDAAYVRARREPRDIDLQILRPLRPERLSEYQHVGSAWLWKGPLAAIVEAPEGWVVDNQETGKPGWCQFSMYPIGHSLDSAKRWTAFLYGNIVLKTVDEPTVEAIATMHERRVVAEIPAAEFERLPPLWSALDNAAKPHLLRVGHIDPSYGGPEYSLYLDDAEGVLLLVLLCPKGLDGIYVPALKWVGAGAVLMKRAAVTGSAP